MDIEKLFGIKLTPQQQTIVDSVGWSKTIVMGRGTGKTTAGLLALIKGATETPSGAFVFVTGTTNTARGNAWPMLFRFLDGRATASHVNMSVHLSNDSKIYVCCFDDFEARFARQRLSGVVLDEDVGFIHDESIQDEINRRIKTWPGYNGNPAPVVEQVLRLWRKQHECVELIRRTLSPRTGWFVRLRDSKSEEPDA